MLINNNLTRDIFLDVTASLHRSLFAKGGFKIPASATNYEMNDMLSTFPEFQALVTASDVTIVSYTNEDWGNVPQGEFNSVTGGIYQVTESVAGVTPIQLNPTRATALSVVENYYFGNNRFLHFVIDSLIDYTYEIPYRSDGWTATMLVNQMVLDPVLNKHLAITLSGGNKVSIQTRSYGANAKIELLDIVNNAQPVLQFATIPAVGTRTTSKFELIAKTSAAVPMNSASVVVGIWDAAVAGSLVANAKIQRIMKGNDVSGLYTNSAVLTTSDTGELDFEVTEISGGVTDIYVSLGKPTGYFLASVPADTARVHIVLA